MNRYLIKQANHKDIDVDTSFRISRGKKWTCRQALDQGKYRNAGWVRANDLNEVFRIGNTEPNKIHKISKFYSISCGDIIVDKETNKAWLVAPVGFELIKVNAI